MTQTSNVDYEKSAGDYAAHRQVHRGVLRMLCERGSLGPASIVLEVGCGTGNYARALVEQLHCWVCGLDPSAAMLAHAQAESRSVAWLLARAEEIGFPANCFDLVFSVDVIHHVADRVAFYAGAARVLQPGGRICTVTDSADIIRRREILSGYFPETIETELNRYPRISQLEAWMHAAGLAGIETLRVEEAYEVVSAQPFRDRAFSSLHLIPEEAWQCGLARLERDLARGTVQGVSRYACVCGHKAAMDQQH